jgi:hypothetical protein
MSTTTIVTKRFISEDGKTIVVSYDASDNVMVQLKIAFAGTELPWMTVEDMKDFMNNMVNAINLVHSVSGSGAGYVPATAGTDGDDPIID